MDWNLVQEWDKKSWLKGDVERGGVILHRTYPFDDRWINVFLGKRKLENIKLLPAYPNIPFNILNKYSKLIPVNNKQAMKFKFKNLRIEAQRQYAELDFYQPRSILLSSPYYIPLTIEEIIDLQNSKDYFNFINYEFLTGEEIHAFVDEAYLIVTMTSFTCHGELPNVLKVVKELRDLIVKSRG